MHETVRVDRRELLERVGNRTFSQRAARAFRGALERPMTINPMSPVPKSRIDAGSGTELIVIVSINWPAETLSLNV